MDNDWTWLKLPHLLSITLEKGMWKTVNDKWRQRTSLLQVEGQTHTTCPQLSSSFSFSSECLRLFLNWHANWMHVWTFISFFSKERGLLNRILLHVADWGVAKHWHFSGWQLQPVIKIIKYIFVCNTNSTLVHPTGSWDKHKLLDSSAFLTVITHRLSWTEPLRFLPTEQVYCFTIQRFTRIQTNLTSLR